jgi:hypothetical protein
MEQKGFPDGFGQIPYAAAQKRATWLAKYPPVYIGGTRWRG